MVTIEASPRFGRQILLSVFETAIGFCFEFRSQRCAPSRNLLPEGERGITLLLGAEGQYKGEKNVRPTATRLVAQKGGEGRLADHGHQQGHGHKALPL